ncbi:hypothetical protein BgiBS90_028955 [Biomphalaria glabrata]|nr:hypothetical protein BgiBS90_028955 [Biomphalaria glabrata]
MIVSLAISLVVLLPLSLEQGPELRPQLNLHFLDPNPNADPESYDVDIETQLNYLFYTLTCKASDNEVIVRVTPSAQTTEFVDKDVQLGSTMPDVQSCFLHGQAPSVNCSKFEYCETSNVCDISLLSACPPADGASSWDRTQYIDLALTLRQKQLYVLRCLALCGDRLPSGASLRRLDDFVLITFAVAFTFKTFGIGVVQRHLEW